MVSGKLKAPQCDLANMVYAEADDPPNFDLTEFDAEMRLRASSRDSRYRAWLPSRRTPRPVSVRHPEMDCPSGGGPWFWQWRPCARSLPSPCPSQSPSLTATV